LVDPVDLDRESLDLVGKARKAVELGVTAVLDLEILRHFVEGALERRAPTECDGERLSLPADGRDDVPDARLRLHRGKRRYLAAPELGPQVPGARVGEG